MKIYKNLLEAVGTALQDIFFNGYYADKVIQRIIKLNPRWGARDRRFIAETTYDIVRNWRYLHEIAGTFQSQQAEHITGIVAVYLFMHGYSDDAFVRASLPNGWNAEAAASFQGPAQIMESYPDWLYETGLRELGEQWHAEARELNLQAEVILRTNTIKISRETLIQVLSEESVAVVPVPESTAALQLVNRQNLFTSQAFKAGLFEIQDTGSQMISEFLGVKPGMRVVDACAGGGGKSLHIAALMQNKGRIIAMDTESKKLGELEKRARRNGISIIETRVIENRKTIKRLKESADCLLLDVPCSGTGVIRRNPDAKWKLNPETLSGLLTIQSEILDFYPVMLKPGGTLVYATCSLFPSENALQVQEFLKKHPEFELQSERTLTPAQNHTDGFYMARLKKVN